VDVKPTADKAILAAAVTRVTDLAFRGVVDGPPSAAVWVVPHHGSNDMLRLRLALGSADVRAASVAFTVGERTYPAGSFLVPAAGSAALREAAARFGLATTGLAAVPDVATMPVDLPRLAVFTTWGRTQEVGWVRHAFDQFGIPYELIYKERIKAGGLKAAYDVILVPNQATTGKALVFDVERKAGPLAYTKDAKFPSLGTYGESDDITGGMGLEGVIELRKFAEEGGVLSGLMRGATEIRRRAALVDTPVGRGRVVAFATNPCYRWQNHGEFGLLFNAAVLFWNDTVPVAKKSTN
jgi:hypothetical protein